MDMTDTGLVTQPTSADEPRVRYALRLADQGDLPHIVNFFKDPERPSTVFERTEEAFGKAIENQLFWLLTDDTSGNILATAAVHILPGHVRIGSTVSRGSSILPKPLSIAVNYAEIGSIWRPGDIPAGFLLDLAYSACILQTYHRAQDLLISTLVTQITANNKEGIKRLLHLQQGWVGSLFHYEYSTPFKSTIADAKNRETELSSFSSPVGEAIVGAAKCLLGKNKNPKFSLLDRHPEVIEAHDLATKKPVRINLRGTGLIPTAMSILNGLSSKDNDRGIRAVLRDESIAWRDAAGVMHKPAAEPQPVAPRAPANAPSQRTRQHAIEGLAATG